MPHLVEVWNEYAPQGLTVLALSDEGADLVAPYIKDNKLPFPVASGSNSGSTYKIEGYPTGFLIDPEGNIAWTGHPMDGAWVKMLPELLSTMKTGWDPGDRDPALAKAVEYARAGKYKSAWEESDRLLKKFKDDATSSAPVEAFRSDFLAMAAEKRQPADKRAEAGHYYQASRFLEGQIKPFAGTPPETEWKDQLKTWKSGPDCKELYDLDKRLADARAVSAKGDRDKALKMLEALKKDAKGTKLEQEIRDVYDDVRMSK